MIRQICRTALMAAGCLTVAAWAQPAGAQAMTCSQATIGQQACQADNICKCAYGGGTMTNQPPGFYWQCDIIYGKCASGAASQTLINTPGGGMSLPGGSPGNRIRNAQSALQRAGFNPGPVDGVIGPRTSGAIRAFQRAQRLPETGTLTPDTLSRLGVG